MDKFAKSGDANRALPQLITSLTFGDSSEDALVFEVRTKEGLIHTVDLTRYRDGDAAKGIGGSPSLILDLLPTIKSAVSNRSKKGILAWIGRRLPTLFKFVTHLHQEVGWAPQTAAEFENEEGALLKEYILLCDLGPFDRRKYFTAIRSLLCEARGPAAPALHWPDIEVGRDLRIHADVHPGAVKELYHTCKRVLDEARGAESIGERWLTCGIRADTLEDFAPRRPKTAGSVRNRAWYDHANLAVLLREMMRERITGERTITPESKDRLTRHLNPCTKSFAGITFSEIYTAFAPTLREVGASVLIVSMETGWIDTVSGIDLSDQWFSHRRGKTNTNDRTASVVLFARRPKTSRRVIAVGQAGTRFRAFQVIQALERRSQFLRSCLIERRGLLASLSPSREALIEIGEIDVKLRSPWLYFNSKGSGSKAVGMFSGHVMSRVLRSLKEQAIAALSPPKKADQGLLEAISILSWSDVRDAFAAHIYSKSGGSVFLVQRALGHNDVSTTRHYLRQKRMIRERFDAFRKMVDFTLKEITRGGSVDPTLIFLSNNLEPIDDRLRSQLASFRTRMGMGCNDPTRPPNYLAPGHVENTLCAVQRCVLCRHGVIFRSAWEGLAIRHGELVWMRDQSNALRWITSTFAWELDAIEYVRDTIFASDREAFVERANASVEALRNGSQFLFDDPELTGTIH